MAVPKHEGHGVEPRELLEEDFLTGEVVTGGAGEVRRVTWVMPLVSQPPPSLDLVGAAVLIGYEMGAPDAETLRVLAKGGAAIIIVPPGLRPTTEALAEVGEAGPPVLVLKEYRPLSELVADVGARILDGRIHVLEYRTSVHRVLARAFTHGEGLGSLLRTMSSLSSSNAFLLHTDGSVLEYAGDVRDKDRIARHLHTAVGEVETAPGSPHHWVDEVRLPEAANAGHAVVARLVLVGGVVRWLALVLAGDAPNDHDARKTRVVLEEGSSLIVAELLRLRAAREAEERSRNDFASALLLDRFRDDRERLSRCEFYRVDLERAHSVLVVSDLQGDCVEGSLPRPALTQLLRTLDSRVPGRNPSVLAVLGTVLVVIKESQVRSSNGRPTDSDDLRYAEAFQALFGDRSTKSVVALGDPHVGAVGVARSYREARLADAYARRAGTAGVAPYSSLLIVAALSEAAGTDAGREFARKVLQPLGRGEDRHELEEVIVAYYEESGNLNAAARRLNMHRNTMLYKLDRASRVLGMNVRNLDALFMVWLARELEALEATERSLQRERGFPDE